MEIYEFVKKTALAKQVYDNIKNALGSGCSCKSAGKKQVVAEQQMVLKMAELDNAKQRVLLHKN